MTIILVGQAPSRSAGRRRAFDGASGKRLAWLAGVAHEELLARVRALNLLREYPGAGTRFQGDRFPLVAARRSARRIEVRGGDVLLLAGRGVASAFGESRRSFFEWFALRGARAAVIPHPSGVSRWWNERSNERRARRFLRSVIGGAR